MAEIWKMKDEKILIQWINDIQEKGKDLTDWEQGFIISITEQLITNHKISQRQEEILEKIYAEKTP